MSEIQDETPAEEQTVKTVAEHRHQAQAHAAELSTAVGDPLKTVRKALKVGKDIRTETVNISYALRGQRHFTQEAQVARLTEVLAKIDAIEVPTAAELRGKALVALTEALQNLEESTVEVSESAQAHLDGLRSEVTKALRLAQSRDFGLHQQRKHGYHQGGSYDTPAAPAWYDPDLTHGTTNGSGLEDGPISAIAETNPTFDAKVQDEPSAPANNEPTDGTNY